tara:strand:- start:1818 stop:2741 length:924 start_codon:yes stop_codon:yes gene_type:complete
MAYTGTPAITSNYAGKAAGFYIAAALKEAKSLEFLTMIENIKYKENIQKMAGASLVADATCDFTDAGTLTMTEAVLTPKNLQVNVDLCKGQLLSSWEAADMRAGANNQTSPRFDEYVISYFSQIIADGVEGSIWNGLDANAGEFTGFSRAGGHLEGDATVVDVDNDGGAGNAYTTANIVTNLTNTLAAVPSAVYGKEDLYIYMSPKSYRLYIAKMSTDGYLNAYNMQGDYAPLFEGTKLAVCPGMQDDVLVAAEKSNLFFGTDLISDATSIRMLDMNDLDGSDNLRVVCKYSGGTIQGVGADIVLTN